MTVPSNGGVQEMLIIPAGDIYRLITNNRIKNIDEDECITTRHDMMIATFLTEDERVSIMLPPLVGKIIPIVD